MSRGGGFPPLLGDPGGGTIEGYMSDTGNGETHVFARSGKMVRSPVSTKSQGAAGSVASSDAKEEQVGLGLGVLFTPKANSSNFQADQQDQQLGRSMDIKKKVDELYEFIKDKHNVHHRIRALVTGIRSGMLAVEREQVALKARAEKAEKQLQEMSMQTPKGGRTGKRDRDTPGDEEVSKKQKEDKHEEDKHEEKESEWRTVQNKKEKKIEKEKIEEKKKEEKKKEEKKKEDKKKEEKKKEDKKIVTTKGQKKPLSRKERIKGDALVVAVKEGASYAELLRKVKADPELEELGKNVVKTRRTQRGEMIFELKKDPTVKSSAFKQLVEKSLGDEASVRALSQGTVIECRDLDEITTVDELTGALMAQCRLDANEPIAIRLRKAYGGTQTATIRLSTTAASKLLEMGTIKVGWSICPLKAASRVTKHTECCFKCMGFGHHARNCEGPDRSKLCRKCGKEGHFASDCTRPPKCMLCKAQDGNDHVTGGFKCPEYKKAKANQK